jgi:hypothetical protein
MEAAEDNVEVDSFTSEDMIPLATWERWCSGSIFDPMFNFWEVNGEELEQFTGVLTIGMSGIIFPFDEPWHFRLNKDLPLLGRSVFIFITVRGIASL